MLLGRKEGHLDGTLVGVDGPDVGKEDGAVGEAVGSKFGATR